MKKTMILLAAGLVFGMGCGGDDDENNANNANNGSAAWEAGAYTMTVLDVQDNCYDGAMDIIVLPSGEPRDFPEPIVIPAPDDLPATMDIEFTAPFESVTDVPVEADGTNGFKTSGTGFTQTGVDITSDGGDCMADMNVEFTMTASADNTFTGSGTLTITSATGVDCPEFQDGPPCTVVSNLSAVKN